MRDFAGALERRPATSVTWFARGIYDRLLITRRDGERIVGLPLISGGATQHMRHPYFPIPFSRGVLEGVPDGTAPVLVPRFTLVDGAQLMPLAFIRGVTVRDTPGATTVTYHQTEMDRLGKSTPVADDRLAVATTYTLEPNRITRRDVFTPKTPLAVTAIRLEFASFSSDPQQEGATTHFGAGVVTAFNATGLDRCTSRTLDRDHTYESDTRSMTALVECTSGETRITAPVTITWSIVFR
jgi:hypothetical protein